MLKSFCIQYNSLFLKLAVAKGSQMNIWRPCIFLILNTYKAVGLLLLRIWSDILGKYRLKGVVLNYSPIQPQSQANYPWYKHSIYGILDCQGLFIEVYQTRVTLVFLV